MQRTDPVPGAVGRAIPLARAAGRLVAVAFLLLVAATLLARDARAQEEAAPQRGVAVDPSGWKLDLDRTRVHLDRTMEGYAHVLRGFHAGAEELDAQAELCRKERTREARARARVVAARTIQEIRGRADAFAAQCADLERSLLADWKEADREVQRLAAEREAAATRVAEHDRRIAALEAEADAASDEALADGDLSNSERMRLHRHYQGICDADYEREEELVAQAEIERDLDDRAAEAELLAGHQAQAFEMLNESRHVSLHLRRAMIALEGELKRADLEEATRDLAQLVEDVRGIPEGFDRMRSALDSFEIEAPEPPLARPANAPGFAAWLAEREEAARERVAQEGR